MKKTLISSLIVLCLAACAKPENAEIVSEKEPSIPDAKLDEIHQVANQGPFVASFESFKQYKIPKWYQDAKFGIFIHWGVYSVPAFNGEWYPRKMYSSNPNHTEKPHHEEVWGPLTEFGYKDFIPLFKAENFDANKWLEIIKNSGARYIVPVAEHHDGFSMYDNSYTQWDSVEMGPKRDIIKELKEASEKAEVHFGLSSHRAENWWFFDGGRKIASDVQDDRYRTLYGPAVDKNTSESGETPPSQEFMNDWLLRTVELVDKYEPELIWFDWWIASESFHEHVETFTAYYYNKGLDWKNMPALNYKEHEEMRSFIPGSAVLDIERGGMTDIHDYFWQTDTSVSKTSWGYVTNHQYRDANSLIDDLIDIVSKNGSLLLNIGPKPDGTIPEPEIELLATMGDWLKLNGEAIYASRPWKVYGEGETEVADGKHTNDAEKHRIDFTSTDIRYTQKQDVLYATLMAWPGDYKQIILRSVDAQRFPHKIKRIELIGNDKPLTFEQNVNGLKVSLPSGAPNHYAQVLKIIY